MKETVLKMFDFEKQKINISPEMLKMLKMLKFLGQVWGTQRDPPETQTLTFPQF